MKDIYETYRRYFIFRGGDVVVRDGSETSMLGADDFARIEAMTGERGDVDSRVADCDIWARLRADADLPDGYRLASRRGLAAMADAQFFARSGAAYLMMEHARRNRFCGVCGAPMAPHPTERARLCTSCGYVSYPSMAPAVIVAVERDGRLLMGHNTAFPEGRYSVLAGFVEPCEDAETTIKREVFEESRVTVKNIRYFMSQPWPFPNSFMLAYQAEWEQGEPTPGDGELTDVRWFARDELPDVPPPGSVSRALIDDWLARG